MTENFRESQPGHAWRRRASRGVVTACVICMGLLTATALAGCSRGPETTGEDETTEAVGARMAGPVVDVNVTQEALDSEPAPPVLTSPESAIRSFLDWTSYAYRIGQSQVALPTMTTYEGVRVDSYIQYNIQKSRLLDQTLQSVTFGTPSLEDARAIVPAREVWIYRYVSIEEAGRVIGGPYDVSYDTIYTVVESESGDWVVDHVEATALGKVE